MFHTQRDQMTPHQFLFSFLYSTICVVYASAMVTSTSTPGSMLMEVICLTISDGLCRSIRRLWILIWKRSQVFDPSPQGVFLVVMRRVWDREEKPEFSMIKMKTRIKNSLLTQLCVDPAQHKHPVRTTVIYTLFSMFCLVELH